MASVCKYERGTALVRLVTNDLRGEGLQVMGNHTLDNRWAIETFRDTTNALQIGQCMYC